MAQSNLKLQADWSVIKEIIKETNIDLTDEDLEFDPDQPGRLIDRLAHKMNRSPEHIKSWIESISSNKGLAS